MKKTSVLVFIGVALLACFAASITAQASDSGDKAEIAALKQQLSELQRSAYHPELGHQMLIIQIRHARLWFAGEAKNWILAAFELQELKEAFEAVVEHNPDDANFQPQRLADILPAMTNAPIRTLRDAIDHGDKKQFENAYDGLSAACTGCHRAAGISFLVIQRPKTPLLDNLRSEPMPAPSKK
ncbi:MAG: hypothetical protein ABI304_05460 [Rudaea sp.]